MLFLLFLVILIFLTLINFFHLIYISVSETLEMKFFDVTDSLTIIIGLLYTLTYLISFDAKDYTEPVINDGFHNPVASWHLLTVLTLFILGIIGYTILRTRKLSLPPLIIVLMLSFIFIGIVVSGILIIQVFNINKELFFISLIFIGIFPFNYILCSLTLIIEILKGYTKKAAEIKTGYNNIILKYLLKFLFHSRNLPLLALIITVPVFLITMLILILFGQQPDSIIKAFTETSDWVFSTKISPPPIKISPHYLCTVSLKGHKSIVKPLRLGIRNGEKIVVNRQLLVANAFEQFIQERIPKTHRFIRHVYDNFGFRLSQHINTAWSADIVYILMKPLEWFFIITLYLFDLNPETRIAKQYLPKMKL